MKSESTPKGNDIYRVRFRPLLLAQALPVAITLTWLIAFSALFGYFTFLLSGRWLLVLLPILVVLSLASLAIDRWSNKARRDFSCPRCGELFLDRKLLGASAWAYARSPKWGKCQHCKLNASWRMR